MGSFIDLNPTMGALFIAVVFSSTLYGTTLLQTVFYYANYPSDAILMKLLVLALWLMDTMSTAMICYGVYTYLVTDFSDVPALMKINKFLVAEPLISGTIASIVHQFMVYRIWTLNKRYGVLCIVISILSLANTIMAYYYAAQAVQAASLTFIQGPRVKWIEEASSALTLIIDVSITVTICYQLYRGRTGVARTERMIDALTLYTITTGMIPMFVCVADLIVFAVAPASLGVEIPEAIYSKVYVNTFMATLNIRRRIRSRDSIDMKPTPRILPPIAFQRNDDESVLFDNTTTGFVSTHPVVAVEHQSMCTTLEECTVGAIEKNREFR